MIYCIFPLKRKRFLLKIQHRSATFSGPRANKKSSSITIVKINTLPAIGRVTDLHRLENVRAGRTEKSTCIFMQVLES